MKKAWSRIVLAVCLVAAAGCAPIPGDGTGLDGRWTGSLATLFTVFDVKLPVAVAPEAVLLFDGGTLTLTLQPDMPILGWLLRVVVDGAYATDGDDSLQKMTLSLGKTSIRLLFFKIPVADLGLTTECIYTIKSRDTLYILPAYDKLPEAVRDLLEASPASIPWEGVTVGGITCTPLKLSRET